MRSVVSIDEPDGQPLTQDALNIVELSSNLLFSFFCLCSYTSTFSMRYKRPTTGHLYEKMVFQLGEGGARL